ncbi:hypothetical protein FN846DRAFT_978452, partial [Sphaerosporella brunnea]
MPEIFFLLFFTASTNCFLSAFAALLIAVCARSRASRAFVASSSSLRTTICVRLVRLRRIASDSWVPLISAAASAPACACASPPFSAVLSLRFRLGVIPLK